MVFIGYKHGIVAVVRWIENEQTDEFVEMLEGAVQN